MIIPPPMHEMSAADVLQSIRMKAGSLKQKVLDDWPYHGRVKAIPAERAKLRSHILRLPQLPRLSENWYEIHMLCGRRDLDMGILASWSIMRFMDGRARLFVHSDGTLHEDDLDLWRWIVGEVLLVTREAADQRAHEALVGSTTHLLPWRSNYWSSQQVVDMHFYGDASAILIMDTDVLVFQRPVEVMAALSSTQPGFAWCRDLRDAYSAKVAMLQEITGVRMPERLNCGFMVCPRLRHEDFMELEAHLERIYRDQRVSLTHFWSGQTYYGLLASGRMGAAPLPDTYDITAGPTTSRQVLRHYVGIPRVRFRYFSEGVPRVLKGI